MARAAAARAAPPKPRAAASKRQRLADQPAFLDDAGNLLEPAFGRVRFGLVYLVSLLAGSFTVTLVSPDDLTLGAGGPLLLVLQVRGECLVLGPRRGELGLELLDSGGDLRRRRGGRGLGRRDLPAGLLGLAPRDLERLAAVWDRILPAA